MELGLDDIDEGGFTLCQPKHADCGRRLTCERLHYKGNREGLVTLDLSCNLDPEGNCPFYVPRPIIADEKHIFRGRHRRHNSHVFQERRKLEFTQAPKRAKPKFEGPLPKEPDLMVKRHIRSGKNIKEGQDDG